MGSGPRVAATRIQRGTRRQPVGLRCAPVTDVWDRGTATVADVLCNSCIVHANDGPEDLAGLQGAAEAFQWATRVLAGVALDGLAASTTSLSLSQFRMLALIDESGQVSIEQAAAALRLTESAAAELAGRLAVAGLVHWQVAAGRRPVVAATLRGRDTVSRVWSSRGRELARILQRLPPVQRAAVADAARGFVEAAASAGYPVGQGRTAPSASDPGT